MEAEKGEGTSANMADGRSRADADAAAGGEPASGSSETSGEDHSNNRKRRRRRSRRARARGKPSGANDRSQAPSDEDCNAGSSGAAGRNSAKGCRQPQGRPLAGVKGAKPAHRAASRDKAAVCAEEGASGSEAARSATGRDCAGDVPLAGSPKRSGGDRAARSGERGRGPWGHRDNPLYAALDLGTNNCRLLVAQPTRPGQFRVVDSFSRIVRLGEGLIGSGRLSECAMDRAVEALKVCAGRIASRSIRSQRLIATEACRSAVNGPEFLARVEAEAGLALEVVDRETEARLAVSGCSSLVEPDTRSVVLFDIGGGSSEIALIRPASERPGRLARHIHAWTSLPVGVVTLSERHGGREVTPEIFEAMVADVAGMLAGFECPGAEDDDGGFHLLGTSGTVTTLAGVHLDLPRYDRRRVDGLWLTSENVDCMIARLLSWDFDQRSANPCIGADRADLVLAGCAILEAIRRRWPAERMRVADRGLREGLLTEMMAADGVWRRGRRGGRRGGARRGGN
ncbi:Ppx/GppA phosphatase family protein [Pararhizobium mangrovi]